MCLNAPIACVKIIGVKGNNDSGPSDASVAIPMSL